MDEPLAKLVAEHFSATAVPMRTKREKVRFCASLRLMHIAVW